MTAEPQYKDGDGDDEDDDVESESSLAFQSICAWTNDTDEQRRAFIIDKMADPTVDGRILVQNMDAIYQWLKDCTVPNKEKTKTIKAV